MTTILTPEQVAHIRAEGPYSGHLPLFSALCNSHEALRQQLGESHDMTADLGKEMEVMQDVLQQLAELVDALSSSLRDFGAGHTGYREAVYRHMAEALDIAERMHGVTYRAPNPGNGDEHYDHSS